MDNEKNLKFDAALRSKEGEFQSEAGSRARNRTVMLTPEITGQVRARLAQDTDPGQPLTLPESTHGGFEGPRPSSSGAFQSPTAHHPVAQPGFSHSSSGAHDQPSDFNPMVSRAQLGAPARPAPASAVVPAHGGIVWSKESKLIGFLVSYDRLPNGEAFDLRTGRLMVTSQGTEPNSLVISDDTVSPMHAVMRISPEGEIQVLDQLSEYGTRIQRYGTTEEEQLSGEKSTVRHGDTIKFGNRAFHVCLVARADPEE